MSTSDIAHVPPLEERMEEGRDLHLCTTLRIERKDIGETGMIFLTSTLVNSQCHLQELWLDNTGMNERELQVMFQVFSQNRSVKFLSLSNNILTAGGLRRIGEGLSNRRSPLLSFRLMSCSLGRPQAASLVTVLRSTPSLTSLNLDNNPLSDAGLRILVPALAYPGSRLRTLRLSTAGLTAASGREIGSILRGNARLRMLALNYNRLLSEGVRGMCSVLPGTRSRLMRLELEENRLDDRCSHQLAESCNAHLSLTALCLSRNSFTDLALPSFLRLCGVSPCLRYLWLSRNSISFKGANSLQDSVPARVTVFV
ncbi:ribonuclease inhibitor-like [Amblyraja radiata]|uniref:ribonuclease inhibitor-like n=1 Tax=Amblyraja radiata TaxID=386614 RepID=UPI0014031594|nr:ribonuclease inhibitor-like [Amblyraja radiata]XP_032906874.1 ribonuclease inhibitor-like [Amblyraja radiata]